MGENISIFKEDKKGLIPKKNTILISINESFCDTEVHMSKIVLSSIEKCSLFLHLSCKNNNVKIQW